MPENPEEDHHLAANLDSQSLIAYRLGRVEKAVEANNTSAVERDSNIMSKLEVLTTLSTQLATTAVRLDSLESWKKGVTSFLVALTLAMVGLIGTVIIRSME